MNGSSEDTAINQGAGGDGIIAINGTGIKSIDDLSTYPEECTLPGQTINVTVVRDNQTMPSPHPSS